MKARLLPLVIALAGALATPAASQSTASRWALVGDYKGQSMLFLGLDTLSGGETARNAVGLGVWMIPLQGQAPMHQTAYVFDCKNETVRETDYWFYEADLTFRNTLKGEGAVETWAETRSLVARMARIACGQSQPAQTFNDMGAAFRYAQQPK